MKIFTAYETTVETAVDAESALMRITDAVRNQEFYGEFTIKTGERVSKYNRKPSFGLYHNSFYLNTTIDIVPENDSSVIHFSFRLFDVVRVLSTVFCSFLLFIQLCLIPAMLAEDCGILFPGLMPLYMIIINLIFLKVGTTISAKKYIARLCKYLPRKELNEQ